MASIFTSSIGKKLIQSISGMFLIAFLLLHGTINFFSVIDTFTGKYGAADGLYQLGCDFMATPIVTLMVPVLALGFVIHILWGMWLSYGNLKARGGFKRYEVASKAKADSWASKNMLVLGMVVLLGIALHLTDFWAKMQLQEFLGKHAENPYDLMDATFGRWWLSALYIAWFVLLWLHLNHGF
ncbi:MAG: succinate dehydrogenase, partial [Bacteroidales bacterium]|nr:succinate dehydrogenase [Bacteroidales bacterium]